jgi:hypothetical protein
MTGSTDTTKLLKHVDGDTYRRFRAHCIAEGMNMGPAISTLMQGVLSGKVTLKVSDSSISATSRPGTWQWPRDREGGIP